VPFLQLRVFFRQTDVVGFQRADGGEALERIGGGDEGTRNRVQRRRHRVGDDGLQFFDGTGIETVENHEGEGQQDQQDRRETHGDKTQGQGICDGFLLTAVCHVFYFPR